MNISPEAKVLHISRSIEEVMNDKSGTKYINRDFKVISKNKLISALELSSKSGQDKLSAPEFSEKVARTVADFLSTTELTTEQKNNVIGKLSEQLNRYEQKFPGTQMVKDVLTKAHQLMNPHLTPHRVSVASIVIDASISRNDACVTECKHVLHSGSPLITSARTLSSMFQFTKNEMFDDTNWLFFSNSSDLVLCLPKPTEKNLSNEEYLHRLGYNTQSLREIPFNKLLKSLNINSSLKDHEYKMRIVNQLPELFVQNIAIKKRFSVLGHGLSSTNNQQGQIVGLPIPAFQSLMKRFESIGMDYLNYKTCYGGGRNLVEGLRKMDPKFTISVCSLDDHVVKLSTESSDRKKFWEEINKLFHQKDLDGTLLKPEDFSSALEHTYGDHTGFPVVAIQGKPYFEAVGVHGKVNILSYKTLASHELNPQRKSIPFKSITSEWAQSGQLMDRINHCKQQIAGLEIINSASGNILKEKYLNLQNLYLESFKKSPVVPPSFSDPIKGLIAEITNLEKDFITPTEKMQSLKVNQECLLIYPQVVRTPIELELNPNGKLPYFVSKVPDHNQTLLTQINTPASPIKVIEESLFREKNSVNVGNTRCVFMVKEINGIDEGAPTSLKNVMVIYDPPVEGRKEVRLAIYERDGNWFSYIQNYEKAVSQEAVLAAIVYYSEKNTPTTEALEFSAGALQVAKQNKEFVQAFLRDSIIDDTQRIQLMRDLQNKSDSQIKALMAPIARLDINLNSVLHDLEEMIRKAKEGKP